MLSTELGSVDGIRVASYDAGQEYDLTATAGERELAEAFVGAELAEEVREQPAHAAVVDQVEGSGPDVPDPDAAATTSAPPKPGRKPKAQ